VANDSGNAGGAQSWYARKPAKSADAAPAAVAAGGRFQSQTLSAAAGGGSRAAVPPERALGDSAKAIGALLEEVSCASSSDDDERVLDIIDALSDRGICYDANSDEKKLLEPFLARAWTLLYRVFADYLALRQSPPSHREDAAAIREELRQLLCNLNGAHTNYSAACASKALRTASVLRRQGALDLDVERALRIHFVAPSVEALRAPPGRTSAASKLPDASASFGSFTAEILTALGQEPVVAEWQLVAREAFRRQELLQRWNDPECMDGRNLAWIAYDLHISSSSSASPSRFELSSLGEVFGCAPRSAKDAPRQIKGRTPQRKVIA
jgi:hypothetical protein